MTWDFSTFRKAGVQTIILFYGSAIYTAIAAQYLDAIPPGSLRIYLLALIGIGGLVVYAHAGMGWTIPRPYFFIITGGASIFAVTNFEGDSNKFALVCLAAMIVCAMLAIALFATERRLATLARVRGRPDPRRHEP